MHSVIASERVSSSIGAKKYIVDLSDEERETLEQFISAGEQRAEGNTRARTLLKSDDGSLIRQ